jgi:hypothetical protein
MNENIKAYIDGASMAYIDVAKYIGDLAANTPSEFPHLVEVLTTIAEACQTKSEGIRKEAEKFIVILDGRTHYDA